LRTRRATENRRLFDARPAPEVVVTAWGAASEAEAAGETVVPTSHRII